jgi:8-amino-7-oxononanoate synthase
MYENELKAIKKANLYRDRKVFDEDLLDLSSNDYLGFAEDRELFELAYERVKRYKTHAPKASQLVNGYHQIHKDFEEYLCARNNFEDCLVVGSGFLANLALLEALPRRGDLLILDEDYHASGLLASKLPQADVKFFKHNDMSDLKDILSSQDYKRAIIAVEGVYSMGGDLINREIFDIADESGAILVVDEAHSGGVLGDNLLGVYEYYNITLKPNHIKMGTLGKAIGSYGAYIQATSHIIEYLQNRAKSIIYATAPSIFDIALSHEAMLKIDKDAKELSIKRDDYISLASNIFDKKLDSLILNIKVGDNQKAQDLKEYAYKNGVLIGSIRPPTVKSAILRVILRLCVKREVLESFLIDLKGKL